MLCMPQSSGNNLPQTEPSIENGTLTFFSLFKALGFEVPEFSYSQGRCLQVRVQCDEREISVSISCLYRGAFQTYSRNVYASAGYISHEFTTATTGYRSFELFMCFNKPYRQGWIVVNQEPTFSDGSPLIGLS
uniref:Uncharacterized protein n=1 Tax=Anopheles culicifacies TaxID=139723 RepID=A0A182MAC7_9DIPT